MPYEQVDIDSIYDYFQDGVGTSIKYFSSPSGSIFWHLYDSIISFSYRLDLSSTFDMGHTCYNSFIIMYLYLEITYLEKNEVWFKFSYNNREYCGPDLSNLESTRTWKYYKK